MSTRREQQKAFIEKMISDWQASGDSILNFCRSRKINPSTFYLWRKKLSGSHNPQKSHFIPIEVIPDKIKSESEKGPILHYPNGCYVQLPKVFDLQLLIWLNKGMGV